MKWINISVVSLTLLVCLLPDAEGATKEELSTVFFRLYKRNGKHVDALLEEAESLILDMDHAKPTVVYLHGYTESLNSTSVNAVVDAYLLRDDHNVIALDWSVIAGQSYLRVVGDVELLGAAAGSALNDMVNAGLSAEKLHLVGHSMGAQAAAYTSRHADFPVQRITGLDPAGPFFNIIELRLTESDAGFVDIIHTDAGFYGIARATGTVDFYPNGGRRIQPGCPLFFSFMSKEDFCSHHRSWVFYAESLAIEKSFLAVPCAKGKRSSARDDSNAIVMGYGTPTDAKGSYCLVTSTSAPYGRGIEGARAV